MEYLKEKKDSVISMKITPSLHSDFDSLCKERNLSKAEMFELFVQKELSKSDAILGEVSNELDSLKNSMSNDANKIVEAILIMNKKLVESKEQVLESEKKKIKKINDAVNAAWLRVCDDIKLTKENKSNPKTYKMYDIITTNSGANVIVSDVNHQTNVLSIFEFPIVRNKIKTKTVSLKEQSKVFYSLSRPEEDLFQDVLNENDL